LLVQRGAALVGLSGQAADDDLPTAMGRSLVRVEPVILGRDQCRGESFWRRRPGYAAP
jgi:hypothetical protein